MKMGKKIVSLMQKAGSAFMFAMLSKSVFANDLLARALEGDVKDSLGSGSMFWKIFILVDIILATAMAVKSKNPMVFIGVTAVAFIPAFLLKTFVF
ncbi:TPA: hypothetical protein KKW30_002126 [Legionella pneumophila]|uniref:Uncharacterized protein n=1 Tax=Legionella pneumophila (strain Lens) TaxID=297245 RepID=Q5WRZ3_LEGPL|nr:MULTISPECIES: hypothetical protein [Legionellaceae]MDW8880456.1 hypothetical protein [Legionella pneumophila subsp. fraseri]AOU47700.1 hypothetical protein A9E84_15430 [Legionella pneumophila]MCH9063144.1 hypothetical protein [Legionella pneumophila serogroup 1]MCH9067727.1 hypothetical protein [Legionella pneumophila serogroup 1]MCH9091620.1 hypothetical protein [Legionella pneumophila serogroup 1]